MLALANSGRRGALRNDPHLANGLSTWAGHVTHDPVAAAHGLPAVSLDEALS